MAGAWRRRTEASIGGLVLADFARLRLPLAQILSQRRGKAFLPLLVFVGHGGQMRAEYAACKAG